jgi:transcriptional regulator with XRE-family HTH domain
MRVGQKARKIVSKPNAVRFERIAQGWETVDFAARLGISRVHLTNIENGAGTSVKTASEIARVLRIDFRDLFEVLPGYNHNGTS